MRLFTGFLLITGLGWSQAARQDGNNIYTGYNNMSAGSWRPPESLKASLPAAAGVNGKVYVVTDGLTSSDCTTGGGIIRALCVSNGSVWISLGGGVGTVAVVGAGTLINTACVTGGGAQTVQTPNATCTIDTSGNVSTPGTATVGNAGGTSGTVTLSGGTSGSGAIGVAAIAGSPNKILIPTTTGAASTFLQTDGANPQQTSWVSVIIKVPVAAPMSPLFVTPVDSTTYYWTPYLGLSTAACANFKNQYSLISPVTGTITDLYVGAFVGGTLGTGESVTYTLSKNCVDTTLTTTGVASGDSNPIVNDTTHTVAVTKGDLLQLKIVTPAWATNPTSVGWIWSVSITE